MNVGKGLSLNDLKALYSKKNEIPLPLCEIKDVLVGSAPLQKLEKLFYARQYDNNDNIKLLCRV